MRQVTRPLQLEALGAAVLLAAHRLFDTGLVVESSHGSQNVAGAGAVAAVQTALEIAALLLVWVWFARGPAEQGRLVRACAAAVCAFVALGKVLSPQFLIWLVPFVALLGGRRGLVAGCLLLDGDDPDAALVSLSLLASGHRPRCARLLARASTRSRARRAAGRAALARGPQETGTRSASIDVARPEDESHSTSTPSMRTSPDAGFRRTGVSRRARRTASSASTPITES